MKKGQGSKIVIHILLILAVFITIGPFVWMFLTSIKTYEEAIRIPPQILPEIPQWGNYTIILEKFPVGILYFNTFFTVVIVVIGQLIISAMAAYAFARLRFPGRDICPLYSKIRFRRAGMLACQRSIDFRYNKQSILPKSNSFRG